MYAHLENIYIEKTRQTFYKLNATVHHININHVTYCILPLTLYQYRSNLSILNLMLKWFKDKHRNPFTIIEINLICQQTTYKMK